MLAYAPAWSKKGIYSTQNTLFPSSARHSGLGCVFVQRDALDRAVDIPSYVALLATSGWANTASVNVVDLNNQVMANVELYEDDLSVHYVTGSGSGNYSHFNMFKHLHSGMAVDEGDNSTMHRQATVDSLPKATTVSDVVSRLADVSDNRYPIYSEGVSHVFSCVIFHVFPFLPVSHFTSFLVFSRCFCPLHPSVHRHMPSL